MFILALDGECHGDRITWDNKTPPTAVNLRAYTEFPGFQGAQRNAVQLGLRRVRLDATMGCNWA
jgi:hypothetical protein